MSSILLHRLATAHGMPPQAVHSWVTPLVDFDLMVVVSFLN